MLGQVVNYYPREEELLGSDPLVAIVVSLWPSNFAELEVLVPMALVARRASVRGVKATAQDLRMRREAVPFDVFGAPGTWRRCES